MRTFIAIGLPSAIRHSLAQLQTRLKSCGANVTWVKPENIHLTLKFLGEIDDRMAQILIKILEDIVRETKGFPLRISSLGAFPRISSPRVIWVGIDQGDTEVKTLAKTIEEKITKIGIAKEPRPFSSHITLGRTRSGARQEMLVKGLSELGGYFEKNTLEAQVTKITFFKSALTPHGPIYETLKEFPLSPPLIQSAG